MTDRDFLLQVQGYGLMTAEVAYYMPDHPGLIQLFVWQQYDVAPRFPVLHRFLGSGWRHLDQLTIVPQGGRELEAHHDPCRRAVIGRAGGRQ
jgi:uncharacterized protein Usg